MSESTAGGGVSVDGPRAMSDGTTHPAVVKLLVRHLAARGEDGARRRVLDLGCGQGALSARLVEAGYAVEAADMFPEIFRVEGVRCQKINAMDALPYEDASLDGVALIEVLEHLEGHTPVFAEVSRVLKPGGRFVFSTPNILSLKSRLRFLMTGYFHSFDPLDPEEISPATQHITAHTLDRYRWVLRRHGLRIVEHATNRHQKTSRKWSWLVPIIQRAGPRKFPERREQVVEQNARHLLLGKNIIVVVEKPVEAMGEVSINVPR